MRAYILILLTLTFMTASTQEAAKKNIYSKNLSAARLVNNAYLTGDTTGIDSVVLPDFIDHTDRGDIGRDALKKIIFIVHKAFPDMKSQIIKEFVDEDYVFTLTRFTGTGNGTMGSPNGPYDFQTIEVYRFENGKIVEHWPYMQPRDFIKLMPKAK